MDALSFLPSLVIPGQGVLTLSFFLALLLGFASYIFILLFGFASMG